MEKLQQESISGPVIENFKFTDIDVFSTKKRQRKDAITDRRKGLIPFPESLANCDNNDTLFAWSLWFHLVLMMRKKLRNGRQRMKRKNRKNYTKTVPDEPVATFSCSNKVLTVTVQSWAAEILQLPEIKTYPCPPYCPLGVYTEIVLKMNGDKNYRTI